MEPIVIVLQVITIAISIVSMILSVVNTVKENRKKHYIKIVTAQRLENMRRVREAAKSILACTHEVLLDSANDATVQECVSALTGISIVLKEAYKQEHELIQCGENLISALKAYVSKLGTKEEVLSVRSQFYELYSIYDFADWQFIKRQSQGKHLDEIEFDEIYNEIEQKYKK